jgi:hypothetical protein
MPNNRPGGVRLTNGLSTIGTRILGRWVAKLVARLLAGFESRHLSKIENRRHNHRIGQHTVAI